MRKDVRVSGTTTTLVGTEALKLCLEEAQTSHLASLPIGNELAYLETFAWLFDAKDRKALSDLSDGSHLSASAKAAPRKRGAPKSKSSAKDADLAATAALGMFKRPRVSGAASSSTG